MSEETAPHGKIPDFKEMKRIINEDSGESRLTKFNSEDLPKLTSHIPEVDNYSELREVAEEMAEALDGSIKLIRRRCGLRILELESALEKFKKLKENESP